MSADNEQLALAVTPGAPPPLSAETVAAVVRRAVAGAGVDKECRGR